MLFSQLNSEAPTHWFTRSDSIEVGRALSKDQMCGIFSPKFYGTLRDTKDVVTACEDTTSMSPTTKQL
jgi:hypothetical protein